MDLIEAPLSSRRRLQPGIRHGEVRLLLRNPHCLWGASGADSLAGGAGSDALFGETAPDILDALDGVQANDRIDGSRGTDFCTADPGDFLAGCLP